MSFQSIGCAFAPGKLVISGAYAVLEGATALVVAVDRGVVADARRPAQFLADEVTAAVAQGAIDSAPFFDASQLRAEGRKLGFGSSAAIVAACIAANRPAPLDKDRLFRDAFAAHRHAQPHGSGIDVAAAVYGGMVACRLDAGRQLLVESRSMPDLQGGEVRVLAAKTASSTHGMLGLLALFAREQPSAYRKHLEALSQMAEQAAGALTFVELASAIRAQRDILTALGGDAQMPIVTPETLQAERALQRRCGTAGGFLHPSGAGGGDVTLWFRPEPAEAVSAELESLLGDSGFELLEVSLGGPGAMRIACDAAISAAPSDATDVSR